jgi:hypothetical protein
MPALKGICIVLDALSMAARNFGKLPSEVIEKIKKQHKDDGD